MKWKCLFLSILCAVFAFAQDTANKPAQAPQNAPKAAPAAPAHQPAAAPAATVPAAAQAAPYQAPALTSKDSWTMVVVPDVQAYVERPRNHGIVELMNGWIVDNIIPLKIQQVLFTAERAPRRAPRTG